MYDSSLQVLICTVGSGLHFCDSSFLSLSSSQKVDPIEVKHLLLQQQKAVLKTEEYSRINVRRSHLFDDSFRYFSKASFDEHKLIRVVFIGEEAVDEGGPRREFFHLLTRDIFCKSGLFVGYPDHVVPSHNVRAVEQNKFYIAGRMISTSLVQGGEAPACFSKAIADYIVYGDVRSPTCIDDIPNFEIKSILKEVSWYR